MTVAGIRFKPVGKTYYFTHEGVTLAENDGVIVETAKGIEFARVVFAAREIPDAEITMPVKPIIRKATPEDFVRLEENEAKKENATSEIKKKVEKHGLAMKIVDVEYTFDNTKLVVYFTSEGRVDFRELVKDLAGHFKMRIELRQIGVRDESKIKGGIAPCGRICCCGQHLSDFAHVSIKMAKTQGLSLNPTKISGLCGRLMCCLEYENHHYNESAKIMPKIGSDVTTPDGAAMVISNNLLKHTVRVKKTNPDGTFSFCDYPVADIKCKITMSEALSDNPDDPSIKSILD